MNYIPLHVHSEYSLLDGLSKTSQISKRIEEIGASACVLSDHGTVSGAVDFHKTLGDNNQKPILGCEMYICYGEPLDKTPDNRKLFHQVIIAKNLEGWKDLLSLVSLSNKKDQFYYKPRVSFDQVAQVAKKGNLISFSGHLGSYVANEITENDELCEDWEKKGATAVKYLQNMFGKGNFFVEIQVLDAQEGDIGYKVANSLRKIAKKTGISPVATPDAHYPRRGDADDQRVLLSTSLKKSIGQIQRDIKNGVQVGLRSFFEGDSFHIPSQEEMKKWHTEEELENTVKIAEMCEEYNILSPPNPPEFNPPGRISPADYLRQLCREGWKEKMPHVGKDHIHFKEYGKRVDNELEVFEEAGLSSYFLIVRDILEFCRQKGYLTGPGRGSAAGCMVSYLIGITQIDPVEYDLVFERFYNAGRNTDGRISMPDIDIDVPKDARTAVINHIKGKYGNDNVAQIVTFQTLKGRAALKRVMQARGNISFEEQNNITRHIMDESKIADDLQDMKEELGTSSIILWALKNRKDKLKDWCIIGEDGDLEGPFAKVFEQSIRLEGTKIIQSKHAAGVVVSPNPISQTCPLIHSADREDKDSIAGLEGPSCEDVGLLKLDVLGIKMLDKIMEVPNILRGLND